jgi:regulator of sirC expression with transglutaminase-like and TPR domain
MDRSISDLDYFRTLVRDPGSIPLLEAAASIGLDAHPSLDLQALLADVDRLAGQLAHDCRHASTETARLQRALRFFYVAQGFAGNRGAYYDPDNSYLHRVIETRRGIPITLAVLFAELARHVGLEVEGVSFPGHFLLRVDLHEGTVVIDPFTGASLDLAELGRRAEAHGASATQLLGPASAHQILVRMLSNLRAIHVEQGRRDLLDKVMERLRILQG